MRNVLVILIGLLVGFAISAAIPQTEQFAFNLYQRALPPVQATEAVKIDTSNLAEMTAREYEQHWKANVQRIEEQPAPYPAFKNEHESQRGGYNSTINERTSNDQRSNRHAHWLNC